MSHAKQVIAVSDISAKVREIETAYRNYLDV